jgi:uncharacterized protein YegL
VRKIDSIILNPNHVGNMSQGMNIKMYESPKNNGIFTASIKVSSEMTNEYVHIALMLDVSGSMEGERITALKKTLLALLYTLSPHDCLTIVTYSSSATMLCSYHSVGTDMTHWIAMIDGLRADGNTNMESAFSILAKHSRANPHAIILLTDGHVNVGATSARAITLPLETNHTFANTAIFTLGFGNDHNQIMLRDIALNTQGNYFYCDKAEDLPQTFGSILGILRDRPAEDIEISIPYEYIWLERHLPKDKGTIRLNFIPGGIEQRFVFRKNVEKPASAPYLSVQYTVKGFGGGRQHVCTFPIANTIDPIADAEMARLNTAAVINQASNLLAGDQVTNAIAKLEEQLKALEADSSIVSLPQVMGLRSLLLDLLDGLKTKAKDPGVMLSHMTSVTTSLVTQRNSSQNSPALERMYTTSAQRSNTANMTAEYDNLIQK